MTAWLLTWLWQGSALAIGVAVALACVPRLNAATRYLIWWGALAALAWLGWASSPYVAATALKGCATAGAGGTGLQPCLPESAMYVPSAPDMFLTIFIGIWVAIALVSLLRLLPGLRAVYALRDGCRPFPSSLESRLPLWLEAKARGRRTQLVIGDAASGATVLGFARPCIAIPSSLVDALTSDELDQVILHEHAHAQRRDDWSRLAQTLLVSVLWIHPAAFFVSRALNREREMACDEWVVARTGLPKAYARCLARAAEVRMRVRGGSTLVPALLGRRHELARRVDRLLAMQGKARRNASLGVVSVAALAIVAVSLQLQSVRFAEIAGIVLPQIAGSSVWTHAPVLDTPNGLFLALAGPPAPRSGRRRSARDAPIAPSAPIAPIAPIAPVAPDLQARVFPGAYSTTDAPTAPSALNALNAPITPIARNVASAAKKTGMGIASVFSRAGVSLARRF